MLTENSSDEEKKEHIENKIRLICRLMASVWENEMQSIPDSFLSGKEFVLAAHVISCRVISLISTHLFLRNFRQIISRMSKTEHKEGEP